MKIATLTWIIALVVGCSSQLDTLENHQERWAQKGPESYQYTYQQGGMLPGMLLNVTVTSRAVSNTSVVSSGLPNTQGIQGKRSRPQSCGN
jgi:hypothetical protein